MDRNRLLHKWCDGVLPVISLSDRLLLNRDGPGGRTHYTTLSCRILWSLVWLYWGLLCGESGHILCILVTLRGRVEKEMLVLLVLQTANLLPLESCHREFSLNNIGRVLILYGGTKSSYFTVGV
jgi:hypothetical protein